MPIVHGFRQLSVHRCKSTEQPVLIGAMGGHQHKALSVHAGCKGASWALWMSEEAKKKVETKETHAEPAPVKDCTCFVAGTRVLTEDLIWKPIEDIREGDYIIGFNREPLQVRHHAKRILQHTRVTRTFNREANVVALTVSTGKTTYVTPDHKFLVRKRQSHNHIWKEAQDLQPGEELVCPFPRLWEPATDWNGGWLSGIYDGEGSVDRPNSKKPNRIGSPRIVVSQNPGPVLNRIISLMSLFGFKFSLNQAKGKRVVNVRLKGHFSEALRFMGMIRPERLLRHWRKQPELASLHSPAPVFVESVVPCNHSEQVYNIQTESGAYFANGLAVSNCGFYIHRTYQGAQLEDINFFYGAMMLGGYFLQLPLVSHVTAIGECVICPEGARIQRYMIDYFVRPENVEPLHGTPESLSFLSNGYPVACEEPSANIEGSLYDLLDEKPTEQIEILLTYFSELFDRPILDPSSLEGCPHCLIASQLRGPKDVTKSMIRDWDRRELVLDD